jgi:hypothetical protein
MLTPLPESATNEESYISDQKKGELIMHHSISASTGRKFRPLVTV